MGRCIKAPVLLLHLLHKAVIMAKFLALSPWHNGASAGKNPINITTYTESDSALIMSIGLL